MPHHRAFVEPLPCRCRRLARGAGDIQRGFARVYQAHFLRSLKRKTFEKLSRFPDIADPARVAGVRTLYDFDDLVTGPLHGFAGAETTTRDRAR